MPPHYTSDRERVDWIDYAKGICIIMVVLMHSTLGVEEAFGGTGFMHAVVEFAKPFRMPDFFLIAGLFLPRAIDRDWRTFFDTKVLRFAYFYALWVTIQFAIKAPHFAAETGWPGVLRSYAEAFVEPFGTLWFIYLLAIFFAVAKMTRGLPPLAIWLVAAALEIAPIDTGWTVIDEFAGRFVYFYTGYILAPHIFALARTVAERPLAAGVALAAWVVVEAVLVHGGEAEWPLVSLVLGFLGAGAVIGSATLLSLRNAFPPLAYCGRNSIVIYLAFFLPMAVTRIGLHKTGLVSDIGVAAILVTTAGGVGPLLLWWAVRDTRLGFLFRRPDRLKLVPSRPVIMQPAE